MLTYGSFTIIGYFVLRNEDFLWPSKMWWKDCGDSNQNHIALFSEPMKDTILCYYMLYLSRYAAAMVSVLLEHK